MNKLNTQEKAQAIYEQYQKIGEIMGNTSRISVMVHDVPELHTLSNDWKISTLESGGQISLTATRDNVTLFSNEKLRVQ